VLPKKTPVQSIADLLREKLSANPLVLSFGKKMVLRVGVVSGSGCAALSEAIDRGLDCFVTGDANYASYNEIADAGINVIFAGHYATETLGLRALESILRGKFQIGTVFIDIPPPV
jgi:putative NIF3 family GTP cyclohydrolase 1 type 2